MGDLVDVSPELATVEERAVDKGVVDLEDEFFQGYVPLRPSIDVGQPDECQLRALDAEANGLGVLVAVRHHKRLNGESFAQRDRLAVSELTKLDVALLDQLRPGTIAAHELFHARHDIQRYCLYSEPFAAKAT